MHSGFTGLMCGQILVRGTSLQRDPEELRDKANPVLRGGVGAAEHSGSRGSVSRCISRPYSAQPCKQGRRGGCYQLAAEESLVVGMGLSACGRPPVAEGRKPGPATRPAFLKAGNMISDTF